PLRVFRYPVKAMVLVAFVTSLAAAFGVDAWRRGDVQRRATAVVTTALLVIAGLGGAALFILHRDPATVAGRLLQQPITDPAVSLAGLSKRLVVAVGLAAV